MCIHVDSLSCCKLVRLCVTTKHDQYGFSNTTPGEWLVKLELAREISVFECGMDPLRLECYTVYVDCSPIRTCTCTGFYVTTLL